MREILAQLEGPLNARKLRKDLGFLKQLGLIDSSGHGKGGALVSARKRIDLWAN
jgi:hypothetical protein